VQYPNLRNLKAGDHIRFVCGRDDALTQVKRVARYNGFEEMLDAEGPANVNPDSPVSSSSPTTAASISPRRKPSVCWRSRSNYSIPPPEPMPRGRMAGTPAAFKELEMATFGWLVLQTCRSGVVAVLGRDS
jgi:hypothetical protein